MEFLERFRGIRSLAEEKTFGKGEFVAQVEERTRAFRAAGLEPGAVLILKRRSGPAFFRDLFAAWKLQATVAPLPESDLVIRWQDSFPGKRVFLADEANEKIEQLAETKHGDNPGNDFPALALFSSGTTGKPKTVILSFQAILHRCRVLAGWIPPDEVARTLCVLPVSFGHGLISNSLFPLYSGAELVLPDVKGFSVTHALLDALEGIRFVSSVPAIWRQVRASGTPIPEFPELRRIHIASAMADGELLTWIREHFPNAGLWNMYGLTETSSWVAGGRVTKDTPVGWVGEALEPDSIRISEEGEVLVKTAALLTHYEGQPDLTRKKLVDGWLRTGDTGYFSGASLVLKGRNDFTINKGGVKIQPEEIETELAGARLVREICVSSVPDPLLGETIGAVYVEQPGVSLTDIQKFLAERLGKAKIPSHWLKVGQLPLLGNGKLDRKAVKLLFAKT